MNSMKQMMTAIVENVEGMMKMESCGLAVMEVVKDGITSFVLVWMKRVYQKTFTVITAPTDLSFSFIPLIHCYILHLYTLYSLYTHLYLPFILLIQSFTHYNSPSNMYTPSLWNAPCVPHYLHVFRNPRK